MRRGGLDRHRHHRERVGHRARRVINDPRGVVWHLGITNEIVQTTSLLRAIERSDMTEREKRKRLKRLGVSFYGFRGLFESYNWRVGWSREHSYAWVMHAVSTGEHKAWISPALSKEGAGADLDRLAAQIKLGEEPRPSHP
jgi:hypothetical protein